MVRNRFTTRWAREYPVIAPTADIGDDPQLHRCEI
jgi:hypothetical protein